jgi:hypothetical protein
MTHPRLLLSLLALIGAGACIRSGRLSSSCSLAPSEAQWTSISASGRLEGTVVDLAATTPISNLGLRLEGTGRAVRTDATGAFRFDSLADGRYVLVTAGAVYQARRDTLMLPVATGLRGTLRLSTVRDALTRCELNQP